MLTYLSVLTTVVGVPHMGECAKLNGIWLAATTLENEQLRSRTVLYSTQRGKCPLTVAAQTLRSGPWVSPAGYSPILR